MEHLGYGPAKPHIFEVPQTCNPWPCQATTRLPEVACPGFKQTGGTSSVGTLGEFLQLGPKKKTLTLDVVILEKTCFFRNNLPMSNIIIEYGKVEIVSFPRTRW